jgi:hypothetical protein
MRANAITTGDISSTTHLAVNVYRSVHSGDVSSIENVLVEAISKSDVMALG